jgi:hypothetical protein
VIDGFVVVKYEEEYKQNKLEVCINIVFEDIFLI